MGAIAVFMRHHVWVAPKVVFRMCGANHISFTAARDGEVVHWNNVSDAFEMESCLKSVFMFGNGYNIITILISKAPM